MNSARTMSTPTMFSRGRYTYNLAPCRCSNRRVCSCSCRLTYVLCFRTPGGQPGVYYTLLYYTIRYSTLLYYTIPYTRYSTILYYTILYCTVLYCILYYTILCYAMLYYTMLCYTILYRGQPGARRPGERTRPAFIIVIVNSYNNNSFMNYVYSVIIVIVKLIFKI